MNLTDPVTMLFGVGIFYERGLEKLGIRTISDLLYHIPFRYIDYSLTTTIDHLQEGETVTIKGKVLEIKNIYIRGRRLTIQKATVSDNTGFLKIAWFNQPYLIKNLQDKIVCLSGKVSKFGKYLTLESPEYEVEKETMVHTGRLVPVYPETHGISSKWLRAKIAIILSKIEKIVDPLPKKIIQEHNLLDVASSLHQIHLPQNSEEIKFARKRLAFDELFYLQLISIIKRNEWQQEKIVKKLKVKEYLPRITKFIEKLPFTLTFSQQKSVKEILADLSKKTPMNRLLQGDVGSGKTVVAALAVYLTYLNGSRTLFMAPTEILALQHYQTLLNLLKPYGLTIALRTGSSKVGNDNSNLIIGTHALLYEKNNFANIALVIIDEQHRFGVEQRARLKKQLTFPHLLTLTATPIPRTIALTLYGNLDMSVIDELPKGRKIIKTYVVPENKFKAGFEWIGKRIKRSQETGLPEQAYIIYPLIEESEILSEVKAAKTEYERIKKSIFPDLRVSLLHGKMKSKEKEEIINNFRAGKSDALVATSVVEVGMDISNATIIVIEGAERFGLAQLHQLRGRVGRNDRDAFCFLFSGKETARLKAMEKYYSGIKLAEIDLKIRGSGEIFGTKQHGRLELKVADLRDIVLIEETRSSALKILEEDITLRKYPQLRQKISPILSLDVQPD